VPLKVKDAVTGVVYVDNRLQSGVFIQDDLDLLTAIASTAAIAIENARLYRIAVEKGRMERELQMAREVQSSLLPKATPEIDGWEFAAYWQPAREVAGDFYDFFPVDLHPAADRRHAPGIGIVIGDVSDKGMPAALFMALSRSTVRASLHRASSPAEGIAQANRLLRADAAGRMFVTLFYALLDPEAGQVTYVNAGHNPALLGRQGEGNPEEPWQELAPTGMALGILDGEAFEERTVQLDRGDHLLLYTDGVTDAMAANGERFGTEKLWHVLRGQRAEPADAVIDALRMELGRFIHAAEQFDDIAMVVVRRS
jgi:sigma-B regulation protein RsbU (phosphoserine phosphatase)